nr:FHA domain-containing protein [Thermoanaerobaculia bacterium]
MSFELHCESQAGHQTLPLGQTELRIGRGPDNDLVLPDPAVSRNHALLSRRGAEWWLVDLGSTNGLEVNGEAVLEARLRPGDRVLIG